RDFFGDNRSVEVAVVGPEAAPVVLVAGFGRPDEQRLRLRRQATLTGLSTRASRPARTASWINWISSEEIVSGAETASDCASDRRITPCGRMALYAFAGSAGSAASASESNAIPTSIPVPPRTSPTSG